MTVRRNHGHVALPFARDNESYGNVRSWPILLQKSRRGVACQQKCATIESRKWIFLINIAH
jgi:hypothetical protein